MKKIVLLVFAAALAVSPAMAAKKMKVKKEVDPNENSWRLVKASFPLVLPSWALPVYFSMQNDETKKDAKKKK
jgi:hypothetical protein